MQLNAIQNSQGKEKKGKIIHENIQIYVTLSHSRNEEQDH